MFSISLLFSVFGQHSEAIQQLSKKDSSRGIGLRLKKSERGVIFPNLGRPRKAESQYTIY